MLPQRIQGATRVLGAPRDWDDAKHGPCMGLPVLDLPSENQGPPRMVSAWEPTPEEMAAIAAGGPVLLFITGHSHPVVSLGVQDPAHGRMVENGALDPGTMARTLWRVKAWIHTSVPVGDAETTALLGAVNDALGLNV